MDLPPYDIGSKWFFFMGTRYIVGQVKALTSCEIVLEKAAWIPQVGRMYEALKSGNFTNVEPFPSGTCVIMRLGVNDATPCLFNLPLQLK